MRLEVRDNGLGTLKGRQTPSNGNISLRTRSALFESLSLIPVAVAVTVFGTEGRFNENARFRSDWRLGCRGLRVQLFIRDLRRTTMHKNDVKQMKGDAYWESN